MQRCQFRFPRRDAGGLPRSLSPLGYVCIGILLFAAHANAEKAPSSQKQLESIATHIVVGKVQAIYTRTEREGNYEYVRKVAEVKITLTGQGNAGEFEGKLDGGTAFKTTGVLAEKVLEDLQAHGTGHGEAEAAAAGGPEDGGFSSTGRGGTRSRGRSQGRSVGRI